MRSKMWLLTAALAGLILAGCVSDREPEEGSGNKKKTVTFALQNVGRGSITYVDSEAGEDSLDNLDIYMFDEDLGTLEKIFRTGEISLSNNSGAKQTATVDVTECAGSKVFFFVGNGAGITSVLDGVRHGETTITGFLESISDVQAALPVTPLLMTGKCRIDDIVTPEDTELEVKLTRRVARFDVNNDKDVTNFTITKILVNNVSMQGHIFGDALGTGSPVMATGKPGEIAFGTQLRANSGETPSVFYTYPTTLGDGKTEISIAGTFRGDERLFTFQSAAGLGIEANKRYMLKVEPITINEIALEYSVAEWDDDTNDMEAKPESNLITYSELKLASGDGKFTGVLADGTADLDITNSTKPNVIKFTTRSLRKSGAEVKVVMEEGDANSMKITVNDPEPVVTYAGAGYEQHFEVTAEFKSDYVLPATAIVEIYNAYDPIQVESFRITRGAAYYPGTTFLPVKLGDVWFAPVNVGATNLGGATISVEDAGLMYQWGRSYYGFPIGTTGDEVVGPLSDSEARSDENKNKFVMATKAQGYHWLMPQNDMAWKGDNAQGPCPTGWRVPTIAEVIPIKDASDRADGSVTLETGRLAVKGDDSSQTLYFQTLVGFRGATATYNYGTGCYWTSDVHDAPGTGARNFKITVSTGVIDLGGHGRTDGHVIRCVAAR